MNDALFKKNGNERKINDRFQREIKVIGCFFDRESESEIKVNGHGH